MGCRPNVVSRMARSRFQALGGQRARADRRKKARERYGWKYRKCKIRAFGRPCR